MLVVSNTSPISNLAIIGRLDFLLRRYGTVHIPPEVADELAALTHPAGSQRIQTALASHWLKVKSLKHPVTSLIPFRLDPGETNAIALARELGADVLLIDEKRGREAARQLGLTVAGALGELVYAKFTGWIPNVRDEIYRLRMEARFFIDPAVEKFILAQVAE